MKRRRRLSLSAVLGLILFEVCGGMPAGAQVQVPLEVERIDTSAHPTVTVTVNSPREFVGRELGTEHFTLFENGREVPAAVRRLPSEGLDVVLAIDTSGSMSGEPMNAARSAAVGFVHAMPPGTRIAVVGFGSQPAVASPFTTDIEPLIAAIEALEASGETALYDAVALAGTSLSGVQGAGNRQFIVLLSDGGDTVSARTLEDASAELAGLGVGFYAVALATPDTDLFALGQLAHAAGGRVVAASQPSEIAGVYETIAAQLVNQYELRYESAAGGETALQIVIEAEGVRAGWNASAVFPALAEGSSVAPPRPAVVPSDPFVGPEPSLAARPWLLWPSIGLFTLGLLFAGWLFTSSHHSRRMAQQLRSIDPAGATSAFVGDIAGRATAFAERAISRNERLGTLDAALERAGVAMRPPEYVVLVASSVLGGAAVTFMVFGPLAAVVVAAALAVGSWQLLVSLRKRRQRKLADQLGDTLQLLAGSLRSGHGLMQAIEMVAREAESPTSEEFHRAIVEVRLGRDVSDALDALAERSGNEDVEWVVQAIRIHREVGGDLAEILDRVGETIRDRNRVRGQIRSLTAEGRLSAILLMALPFLVGSWMWFTNRPYISELFTRPGGRALLLVGAVLMTCGALVMRRLVRPEF